MTAARLQSFHASFKRCRYDLTRWRTVSALSPAATAALDADGGAGWQLAEALLRPRKVQVRANGSRERERRSSRFYVPGFFPVMRACSDPVFLTLFVSLLHIFRVL